jgi:hypothetical protein
MAGCILQLIHGRLLFFFVVVVVVVDIGHTVRSWMPSVAVPHGAICMAL